MYTDPERYGVVAALDKDGIMPYQVLKKNHQIQRANYAVVGLYFYPNSVVEIAKNMSSQVSAWRA